MTCTTQEDFNAAIEHGRIINDTHPDQTAEVSVAFLDNTQKFVSKVDGKYTAGEAVIDQSVTEKVAKEVPYTGKANPLLEQQGEVGNEAHELTQFVTESILGFTQSMSNDNALEFVKNYNEVPEGLKKIYTKYGKSLDLKSEKNLIEGVKNNLLSIYKIQRTINQLTGKDGKVTIRTEYVVIDPTRNIGGTIDFLAIFSDNTAAIVDYKTKILPKSNQDAYGNILDPNKVITQYDLKKYKLQTGEYGRILREAYGIKSIAHVTVLPIKLNVELNVKLGKYANKITGLAFPGQDKLLEKVLPFTNQTRFKSLDDFLRNVDDQIKKLEQKIKANPKQRDELIEKLEKLELGKKDILMNHNLNTILDYGKFLADKVANAELGKLSIAELQDLISELELLASLADSTFDYREFLKNTSKKDELDEISKKISSVRGELDDRIELLKEVLFEDKITKLIEVHTGFKITDDFGNYIPFAQEGYFGKQFYQLSQYDNPVFKTLKKLLNEINYNTRQKVDKVVENIVDVENKVYSWLQSTGRSFEDLIKIMINPKTDNFYGKYSKEFSDLLKSLSDDEIHKFYEPGETYSDWYNETLIRRVDQFKNQEGLTGKDLQDKVDNWIKKNNLTITNGKPEYPEAWNQAKRFNKLHLKDSPEHYNENYKFIQSVPELKNYYSMFEEYNKEFRDLLGVDYNQLPNNFLPNVRKQMSERITEQGFNGFLAGTADFFKDFSIREEDRSQDSTYNSNNQIPIFFLNPFRSTDGDLQVGEKSYQLGRSLAIFAKMAYYYEASSKREAEILALQQFLTTEAEQITQSRGKNMIDQMGNQITEKLQAEELPQIFKDFVDMYIYKIGVKSTLGDKSGRAEKMLLKAKEYFTLKTLGLNVIAGLGSLASAKINTLVEANKGIIFNKTNYKESMQASWSEREKFLAINAFFDPMSHRLNNPRLVEETKYGERFYSDPTMRGWINKYVNSRMLMNTFSVGDQYIEEMILVAMAKNYYVDTNGNLRRIKNDADLELHKGRLIWDLFSYSKESGAKLDITESQMQNAFESFREAVQAGQSRIKGTIPDEDKAHWQTNIIMQLVMHFKGWMPGVLFERFGKVRFDSRIDSIYMGKYIALSKEFSNPDKLVFKEFFKKILLPKMGRLVADVATFGMLSKSRLNDKFNKELAFEKWLDENPHYKGKVTFEEFNEVQQKQLRSVIQELRVLLLIAGLIVMMGMDWDDDGEKDYKKYLLTRKLASLIFKVQQEVSFVYNINAFNSMVKNPIPMLGLVSDATKTITNTLDEILDIPFGEERLIGGTDNDKQPILYNTHKWVPGMSGVVRFLDIFNSDVSYEKINN